MYSRSQVIIKKLFEQKILEISELEFDEEGCKNETEKKNPFATYEFAGILQHETMNKWQEFWENRNPSSGRFNDSI